MDQRQVQIPRRYIRDFSNPFEEFSDQDFTNRYRFSKEVVLHHILPIIRDDVIRPTNRGLPVPPELQLLMALRFYASGNFQRVTGDLRGFSQPTVCRCLKAVSRALASQLHRNIYFPRTVEGQVQNIKEFYRIARFPNVAGCIDGTLIKIISPGKEIAEIFRSRKGLFSLNIMAAVDAKGRFLFIDVRHPGSTHDQTCFDRSALKTMFVQNKVRGLLLGDNGYGCKPYLLTPVINPITEFERNYNEKHRKTRSVVERTFGRWKRKFFCLQRTLLNKLDNSIAIICATAVLWNLHIDLQNRNNLAIIREDEEPEENDYLLDQPPANIK